MRYRDCLTPADFARLAEEAAQLEGSYTAAAAHDEAMIAATIEDDEPRVRCRWCDGPLARIGDEACEECVEEAAADATLRRAALDHRGQP